MEVFLVPVGPDRYELYCEVPDEPHESEPEPSAGFVKRLVHRFKTMVAEAERERRQGRPEGTPPGWMSRVKARTLRWVAESIAEQRLLWHLRRQEAATFFFPDDLEGARAIDIRRTQLKKDFEKHRFWLAIDSVGFVISGALMLLPGPNVLAYYFAFRMVGHYLSLRGARQGLDAVVWRDEASAPLTELRRALSFGADAREHHVRAIADRLRLEHLAAFFARAAQTS